MAANYFTIFFLPGMVWKPTMPFWLMRNTKTCEYDSNCNKMNITSTIIATIVEFYNSKVNHCMQCGHWPVAQISQCTSSVSHNAPFCYRNVHMCAHFCDKMAHCGIFVWCIVEIVRWHGWNMDHTSNSQNTPHISPSLVSYSAFVVSVWKKIIKSISAYQILCCVMLSEFGREQIGQTTHWIELQTLRWFSVRLW